jgi:drug/metabolite transporter (DMT)-like permease
MQMSNRTKGLYVSLIGVFILSPDSLLIRLLNLNDISLIFYRGILPAIATSLLLLIYYKKNIIKAFILIGYAGLLYAFLYSIVHIAFAYSIQHTAVANTLVLIASAPIFTAILSLIFLKENPTPITWLIIFFALISIIIIGWGSYTSDGFIGDLFALITGIGMAAGAILVRYCKDKDLVPSVVIGCILTTLYCLPFSPDLTVNNEQIIYLFLMGFIVIPCAFIVLTVAPRYAPAHEVTLIFLLESILGTLWVWFVISEKPPLNTLIGGTMLLSSVFVFVFITAKEEYKSSVL